MRAGLPPGPFVTPEGVRSGLRRGGLVASSEEVTSIPVWRPAVPMIAWAFPLALHPSKRSPCRQQVSRQPSSRLRLGSFGSHQANLVFPSLAGHCNRLVRATAVLALSPLLTIRARLSGTFRERMVPVRVAVIGHSTSRPCSTVKSVATARRFRRDVARCFLGLRSIEGLRQSCVDCLLVAMPMCRSTRRTDTEASWCDLQ